MTVLVTVLTALLHLGKRLEPGEDVDLPDDAAERLGALGVCRPASVEPPPSGEGLFPGVDQVETGRAIARGLVAEQRRGKRAR